MYHMITDHLSTCSSADIPQIVMSRPQMHYCCFMLLTWVCLWTSGTAFVAVAANYTCSYTLQMCEVVACQGAPVYFKCIGPASLKLLLAALVSPVSHMVLGLSIFYLTYLHYV